MITPLEDSTVHRPPRLHAVTVAKYITPGSNTPLQVKSTRIENTGQIQSVHSKLRKGKIRGCSIGNVPWSENL